MPEEQKVVKKPFKGVSQIALRWFLIVFLIQAQVLWPVDMPDDMLEDAIQISKKAMDEHDFEEHGVDVSITE